MTFIKNVFFSIILVLSGHSAFSQFSIELEDAFKENRRNDIKGLVNKYRASSRFKCEFNDSLCHNISQITEQILHQYSIDEEISKSRKSDRQIFKWLSFSGNTQPTKIKLIYPITDVTITNSIDFQSEKNDSNDSSIVYDLTNYQRLDSNGTNFDDFIFDSTLVRFVNNFLEKKNSETGAVSDREARYQFLNESFWGVSQASISKKTAEEGVKNRWYLGYAIKFQAFYFNKIMDTAMVRILYDNVTSNVYFRKSAGNWMLSRLGYTKIDN